MAGESTADAGNVIPPPPRVTGDPSVDSFASNQYLWDFYRRGILSGGLLQTNQLPGEFSTLLEEQFAGLLAEQFPGRFEEDYPKLAAIDALAYLADRISYSTSAGAFALATLTSYARTLIAAINATAARGVLGLGSMAIQNNGAVSITGGSVQGTDVPYLVARNNTQVSHTGDTIETTLATVTLPPAVMGINGILRISSLWSYTNSGNNKTLRIKFDGNNVLAGTVSATDSYADERLIANRNAANSQIARAVASGYGTGGTVTTMAVDTTLSKDITFTVQLANAGETVNLEQFWIELLT